MTTSSERRFQDLESRFTELEGKLKQTPEKDAISILHAMLQETMRSHPQQAGDGDGPHSGDATLEQIANLYKHAPAMQGAAENKGLPVATKAPDFSLPDASAKPVKLSDFRGQPVVLVFYPLDWSPACSDQLSLYQQELDEFKRVGAQLLCVSVDSIYSHGAWAAVRGLTFPLLSDFNPKGQVARSYGVMRDSDGFSERALYIIDPDGTIQYQYVSPKLDHIPDIYELLSQLKKLEPAPAEAGAK